MKEETNSAIEAVVREVVNDMESIVRSDGASMSISRLSVQDGLLEIDYFHPLGTDCDECSIDPGTLKLFITEALKERDIKLSVQVR